MTRTILGVLLAPLWVVLLGGLYAAYVLKKPDFMTNVDRSSWVTIGVTLAACTGYGTMLLLGLPAHALLKKSRRARAVDYVLSFMAIGALAWVSAFLASGLVGSAGFSFTLRELADTLLHRPHIPAFAALLGALMGGTFWAMARPDLHRASARQLSTGPHQPGR